MSQDARSQSVAAGPERWLPWVVALCVVTAAGDRMYEKHVHFDLERAFNFFGFCGLVSALALLLLSKSVRDLLKKFGWSSTNQEVQIPATPADRSILKNRGSSVRGSRDE